MSTPLHKKPAAENIYFRCDPEKNTACSKTNCHLNGGPCQYTKFRCYAVDPDVFTIMIPTDGCEIKEVAIDVREENVTQ